MRAARNPADSLFTALMACGLLMLGALLSLGAFDALCKLGVL